MKALLLALLVLLAGCTPGGPRFVASGTVAVDAQASSEEPPHPEP